MSCFYLEEGKKMIGLLFGTLAVGVSIVGFIPYLISCIRNETKPHMFSWLLWGGTGFAVYYGQFINGAGAGAWVVLTESILCTVIGLMAVFKGEHDISKSDWLSLIFASIGIGIFISSDQEELALASLAVVDLIAFYPTFRKCWFKPYEENMTLYALSTLSMLLSVAALDAYDFATLFNLSAVVVLQVGLMGMMMWRRRIADHNDHGLHYHLS